VWSAERGSPRAVTAAWQTVFHYHLHVIPRYDDDPLKLPWIPRGAEMSEIARIAAQIRGE